VRACLTLLQLLYTHAAHWPHSPIPTHPPPTHTHTPQPQSAQGGSYSVTTVTPKGVQWLAAREPAPLKLMLPAHMEVEETRQRRREAAEAQRAAEREAAQHKRDAEAEERQALMAALRAARKAVADSLGQVRGSGWCGAVCAAVVRLLSLGNGVRTLSGLCVFGRPNTCCCCHAMPCLAVLTPAGTRHPGQRSHAAAAG
jgi:hypothetical protein